MFRMGKKIYPQINLPFNFLIQNISSITILGVPTHGKNN